MGQILCESLAPSLILIILFNGSFLTRLQDGPFWRHITEAERIFCRENWWRNLLFVNNYLLKESCAQQTWYIAADMQLFQLFLIVIIITNKLPQLTKFVNYILFILIFAIPILLTYILKLDAVFHLNPETYRYLYFRNSDTFYQIYSPFYTNLGGYYFGYLSASFYLKLRNVKVYHGNLLFQLGFWLLPVLAICILLSGFIFIKYDFERPSIWLALYAGIYKNLWIIICAGFVFCMCFKMGWLAYEICCHPIFRPLARISFQAFLWHVFVLRLIAGYFRQPIYVNHLFMFSNVIVAFVLTNFLAFILTLFFEYPMAEIMKLIFKIRKEQPMNDNKTITSNLTKMEKF